MSKKEKSLSNPEPILFEAWQHQSYRSTDSCGTITAEQNNHIRGDTPLVVQCVLLPQEQTEPEVDGNVIDWGGCSIYGESVIGTLIRHCDTTGNAQDNLIVVILGENKNERKNE
jgi:hypothetical protein